MSVLAPVFSGKGNWLIWLVPQRLGRAVERLLAAGAEGAILPALGSRLRAGGGNGRPRGQRPRERRGHAG
jgi:hypothetical protein